MDAALRALADFSQALAEEMEAYFGKRGENQFMRDIIAAAGKCFNWTELVAKAPQREHFDALRQLLRYLKPTLRHTELPDRAQFPYAYQRFSELSWHELGRQYLELTRRLRRVCKGGGKYVHTWLPPVDYIVQPIFLPALLARSLMRASLMRADPLRAATSCALVAEFLVGQHSFRVKATSLCKVGYGKGYQKLRYGRRHEMRFRGRIGSVASIVSQPFQGYWVRVLEAVCEVNESAVAGAMDADKSLNEAGPDQPHCWHVVRMHHRVRHLRCVGASVCQYTLMRRDASFVPL